MELDFPEIKTGNGIDRDYMATMNDRLKRAVIGLNSLEVSIKKLEETIVQLNKKNDLLQKSMVVLSVITAIVAIF